MRITKNVVRLRVGHACDVSVCTDYAEYERQLFNGKRQRFCGYHWQYARYRRDAGALVAGDPREGETKR